MSTVSIEDPEFDLVFITDMLSMVLTATIVFVAALAPYTPFLALMGTALVFSASISVVTRIKSLRKYVRIWFR